MLKAKKNQKPALKKCGFYQIKWGEISQRLGLKIKKYAVIHSEVGKDLLSSSHKLRANPQPKSRYNKQK